MSYLCIFDGFNFDYHDKSKDFKEETICIIGKDGDICLDAAFQDISPQQGKIRSLYQNLYYTEYLNKLPTQFNNHNIIPEETFPISANGNLLNVFSFMQKDPYDPEKIFPVAFMFLSARDDNWDFYSMEYETIKVGGSYMECDIYLNDAPYDFLTFSYNPGREVYQMDVSEETQSNFFIINDDNIRESLENALLLENSKTYRFIYDDKYIFIVGGAFILYARL